MNILIGINNEKIFRELKKKNNLNIISNNILYKEGIVEILEKNNNIQYIIISENLNGQIKIEQLIRKIKKINSQIRIIMILNKKDFAKEEYLLKNKIKYILKEELSTEKILELIFNKNKIIGITGSGGTGKTITTFILSELFIRSKKVLIIDDNIQNNSIIKIYQKENIRNNEKNKIIKIKDNLDLLNIKNILNSYKKDKIKIANEINKIKNNYQIILIDMQNINSYKIYQEIIDEIILIFSPNLLEMNKIKKFILKQSEKIKVILNNDNENAISEEIINNIFKSKIKIIGKIKYNSHYDLIMNHHFNMQYLDKATKNNYLKIIKEL